MAIQQTAADAPELPTGLRFKAGMVLFVLGIVPLWLFAPLVFYSLPLATLGTLVASLAVFQKIAFVSAIAVLGKTGFTYLRSKVVGQLTPPAEVSPMRYTIGLVMFCLPIFQNVLETYASHIAPSLVANRLWVDLLMDLMLFASVFVLGGNFWDKLRALFVRDARAAFPDDRKAAAIS